MNIAKLDDFSKKELETLLTLIVMREQTRNLSDINQKVEFDILRVWHVQILNAIGVVGMRDYIASN